MPSFVSILKPATQPTFFVLKKVEILKGCWIGRQITEHRLPRDFDYHRMPAPWLQAHPGIPQAVNVMNGCDELLCELDLFREHLLALTL